MTDHVLIDVADGVATLTMNRPGTRNALSHEMRAEMADFLDTHRDDPAVRCIVLKGAGEHFMAGGDVKSFAEFARDMSPVERRTYFERRIHNGHRLILQLRDQPQPIIAAVRGGAAGYGVSLSLASDLAIASDNAFFTLAYVNIATSPDGSSSYFLPRAVGLKKAMEIALLGDRFDAYEAARLGVVNRVVPDSDLEGEVDKLARRLANGPAHALASIKRLVHGSLDNDVDRQLRMEAESFAACSMTADWAEGVTAFAEKRKPRFGEG